MRKIILSVIFVLCLSTDLVSKYFAELYLKNADSISIIGDFLQFKLSYNSGIAFSLPIEWIVLQIITIGLIWAIISTYIRWEYQKNSRILDLGYVFILSWAIPHAYERIFVGHVVDFIAVKYFAILNIADIFISMWVFLLILYYVRYEFYRKQ